MRALEGLLVASEKEAMAYCQMELYEMDYLVMIVNDYFTFAVPKNPTITPVLLMAHIDTRRKDDEVILVQHGDTLINLNGVACGCLGADDRAGAYVVLEIARSMKHKPYILLTLGEETSYHGTDAFINAEHPEVSMLPESAYLGKKIWEPYLDDLYAVVQFDRKGFNEATFYHESFDSELFKNKALSLGYAVFNNGSSDSYPVCEALGIAGVNLSCGFMHQHTPEELLLIPAIKFAIDNGRRMLALIDEKIPLPPKKKYVSNYPPIFNFTGPLPQRPPANFVPANTKEYASKVACDICGKKRPCTWVKHAKALVCDKCINRIGGMSYISQETIFDHIRELDATRARSRRANRGEVTPCPVCFDTDTLYPQKNGITYCPKCRTYHLEHDDAVYFWADGQREKVFVRKYNDPAHILEMHDPMNSVPLEWCHTCDMIYHRNETRNYDGFIVCDRCNIVDPKN